VINTSLGVIVLLGFSRISRTDESAKKTDMSRRDIIARGNNGGLETDGKVGVIGIHVGIFRLGRAERRGSDYLTHKRVSLGKTRCLRVNAVVGNKIVTLEDRKTTRHGESSQETLRVVDEVDDSVG
jgi:hypothetical protein